MTKNIAWWYRDGKWEPGPHALTWPDGQGGWDKAADACGFYRFTSSHRLGDATGVTVYQRPPKDGETRETWAIVLDSEGSDVVYATSLPDTMTVLGQWAPAINLLNIDSLPAIIADGIETAVEYFAQTSSRVNLEEVARIIRGAR
jgi:hypothetical protein